MKKILLPIRIEVSGGFTEILIPVNAPLPYRGKEIFYGTIHSENLFSINLYEGNRILAKNNKCIHSQDYHIKNMYKNIILEYYVNELYDLDIKVYQSPNENVLKFTVFHNDICTDMNISNIIMNETKEINDDIIKEKYNLRLLIKEFVTNTYNTISDKQIIEKLNLIDIKFKKKGSSYEKIKRHLKMAIDLCSIDSENITANEYENVLTELEENINPYFKAMDSSYY
jgi:molecular chaperone DnaK (HSP70)